MQVEYRGLVPVKSGAKSPLRYPGGKSRAVKHILPLIPAGTATLLSPFLGGGSVELAAAACGLPVRGYDVFAPLVNFWRAALVDPAALATLVEREYPLPRARFYELQRELRQGCPPGAASAATFFVLNRASVSGSTLSGGTSEGDRFTPSAINRLRGFACPNLTVDQARFEDSLAAHPDDFVYADPPYVTAAKLYGDRGDTHKGFDHEGLAALLKVRESSWILSYDDCPEVRALYRGHAMLTPAWTYGMRNGRSSSELLILSHDLAERHRTGAHPRPTAMRETPVACGYATAAA